ncbi:MAG: hypothetical protein CM15mP74_07490 [Halieaceae bacterium]|nr:MAG: hypothetical protein CM15mP74_07490 [Halieaceae bacterium]
MKALTLSLPSEEYLADRAAQRGWLTLRKSISNDVASKRQWARRWILHGVRC